MQIEGVGASALAPTRQPKSAPHPAASSDSSQFAAALKQQKSREVINARRTQLSTSEAKTALREAWTQQFGTAPREETVAVLTAQWSHETGNGHSMFNYNFGGIKGVGPSGLSVQQRTREGYGDHEKTIRDHFRAYQNATEGASDYLSLLARKYPQAVEAAHEGKPAQFVRELKKGGYFTGSESAYIKSVERRTEQILGHSRNSIDSPAPSMTLALAQSSAVSSSPPTLAVERSPASNDDRNPPSHTVNSISLPDWKAAPHLAAGPPSSSGSNGIDQGLPRSFDLQNFDDALSRAALRIALDPTGPNRERT